MIFFILTLLLTFTVLLSVVIGAIIIYHFKRFGIKDDPNIKKILNTFLIGTFFLIGVNIILLFLFT